MTAVVAMEAVVSIVTEMIAAGPVEGETEETIGIVKVVAETLEVVETNGETKETEAETGAVTKETGVVTRETGVVVKVETGETSREGGTRETVGGTKDSGTRAPIRDTGNGTMLRLRGNNRQLVSNKPGGTSRVTGPNNNSSNSSSTPPIRNTSSGTANRLSRITPPAEAGPVAPSRSLQDCAGSLLSVLFSLLGSPSLLCIYSRPILRCVTWYL
eukprot:XP_011434327.2 PREDICTED: uncharacterized protein LOC105333178 [Crassostrea gigas]